MGYLRLENGITQAFEETKLQKGELILEKYNIRINQRFYEVSSNRIFKEIFDAWGWSTEIDQAKFAFFHTFGGVCRCITDIAGAETARCSNWYVNGCAVWNGQGICLGGLQTDHQLC